MVSCIPVKSAFCAWALMAASCPNCCNPADSAPAKK